jgi:5-methylcytosine-specific restriction endonuclease McrA
MPFTKGHNIRRPPGYKASKETRRKLSMVHKKRGTVPPSRLGSIPWNKGIRIDRILHPKMGNWKGGITPLTKSIRACFKNRQWISDVFTRDDFTCQVCGVRGGNLEADHYPKMFSVIFKENNVSSLEQALDCEEFWNINNGRTLCKKCHNLTKKRNAK